MTCRIAGSTLDLEVPLARVDRFPAAARWDSRGRHSAGVVAAAGTQRAQCFCRDDRSVGAARCESDRPVNCGAEFEVHLTPAARDRSD